MENTTQQQNTVVKQRKSKKPTGFELHPENINHNGRPKKRQAQSERLRDILDEYTDLKGSVPKKQRGVLRTRGELLLRSMVTKAYNGDASMARLVMNYADGMPAQRLEHTGANGGALTIDSIVRKIAEDKADELPDMDEPAEKQSK